MISQLGERIKNHRIQKGLTLKNLSEVTGLSVSFLSQVERNSSSLSITSLHSIAGALGINLTDLFQSPENQACVVKKQEQGTFRLESSATEYCRLAGNFENRTLEPLLVVIPPNSKNGDKFAHPGEEFYMVLEGTVSAYVGDSEYILHEGDSIHFSSSVVHSLENHTAKPVKLVAVLAPRIF